MLFQVQDELRQLSQIRDLVSQLYMALHVPDTYQTEMDSMRKQLEEIRAELQPLEEVDIGSTAPPQICLSAFAEMGKY